MTPPIPIRRATLQDVAREAGVSPITAWRALNQPQVVAARTVERVHGAVEAFGYVPNAVARGLVSTRSRTVGAIVPSVSNWMFADAIQGMSDALHAAGYELLLGCSSYDQEAEEQAVRAMIGRQSRIHDLGASGQGSTYGGFEQREVCAAQHDPVCPSSRSGTMARARSTCRSGSPTVPSAPRLPGS